MSEITNLENQFDARLGKPEDNRDVLKQMANEFFRKLYGMVEDAGGDADYIQGWIDGVDNDLDCAFADLIESCADRRRMLSSSTARAVSHLGDAVPVLQSAVKGASLS